VYGVVSVRMSGSTHVLAEQRHLTVVQVAVCSKNVNNIPLYSFQIAHHGSERPNMCTCVDLACASWCVARIILLL